LILYPICVKLFPVCPRIGTEEAEQKRDGCP
jgi:hypothetical protein